MIIVLLILTWIANVNGAYIPLACWLLEAFIVWVTFVGWLESRKQERQFFENIKGVKVVSVEDNTQDNTEETIGDKDEDDGK